VTNDEIAKDWRSRPISPLSWKPCQNQAGVVESEARGCYAEADGFPRRVYMKPIEALRDEATHARAAREKIAADLAFDLGLPVPPVQLTMYQMTKGMIPAGVSLVMYPVQWSWDQVKTAEVKPTVHGAALAKVLGACSPMLAFDTWVKQTDHHDHPHNIIWGYDPEDLPDSRVVFLDYANSMGYDKSWRTGGWAHVVEALFPPLLLKYLDKKALAGAVRSIAEYPEASIREIVTRNPESHLSKEQQDLILEGLVGRRKLVEGALAGRLEKTTT
jgi:hypothetical protein